MEHSLLLSILALQAHTAITQDCMQKNNVLNALQVITVVSLVCQNQRVNVTRVIIAQVVLLFLILKSLLVQLGTIVLVAVTNQFLVQEEHTL